MPNLKEVRTRIASVNSTKQITSAMKLVSASKLRRTQNAILKLRPYASKLSEIMQNLSDSIDNTDVAVLFEQRPPEKILLIVISSNRGMCGAFNSNIIKTTTSLIDEQFKNQYINNKVDIICIGKKAGDYFSKRKYNLILRLDDLFDKLTYEKTVPAAEKIISDFIAKKYDKIVIVYNKFKNAGSQIIQTEQFLPILPSTNSQKKLNDYLFEPNKSDLLNELVPKNLKTQFYKVILDSFASEHGARMTAMHKATENASEMLKFLKLSYNKARQASITNEILEIVGGAEALKG